MAITAIIKNKKNIFTERIDWDGDGGWSEPGAFKTVTSGVQINFI
jgi:hypothetical protein